MITSIGQRSLPIHGPTQAVIAHEKLAAARLSLAQRDEGDFTVDMSVFSFTLMWIAIAMTHGVCIGCFGIQSWVYVQLPLSSLAHNLELYDVTMAPSNFRVVAVVYGAFAILHCLLLLEMVVTSLWHHKFRFGTKSKKLWQSMRMIQNRRVHSLKTFVCCIFSFVADEHGFFGVKGRYFGATYALREIFETVLQSSQAYRMSQFVPLLPVNRFFVLTIVVNCWSTPIINYAFTGYPPLERMLCLMFDIALDFTSTVGVPVVLAIPYWKQYDFEAKNFSKLLYWNDFWFVNMINQLRIVLVSSWSNLLSELTFLVSLLLALQDIKHLAGVYPKYQGKLKKRKLARSRIKPIVSLDELKILASERDRGFSSGFVKVAHMFMVSWGFLLLILHFHASLRTNAMHCAQQTWPWFGTKPGCMFLRVNCNVSIDNTGSLKEIDAVLAGLNEQTLSYIVVRNCPYIEMPPRIKRFTNLVGVKIYNSTLARWDSDAALTKTNHPKIVFLVVVETNMTHIPLGFLSPDFPHKLSDIEFAWTNLTALPDNLSEIWPRDGFLMVERSPINTVPFAFLQKPMHQVSVTGNGITQLPTEVFTNPMASSIWLNGNPISILPEGLVPSKTITYLDLSNTMLQSLPSWVDAEFLIHASVVAGGTPLCDQLESIIGRGRGGNTALTSSLAVAWAGLQKGQFSCSSSGSYYYLYDTEAQQ